MNDRVLQFHDNGDGHDDGGDDDDFDDKKVRIYYLQAEIPVEGK